MSKVKIYSPKWKDITVNAISTFDGITKIHERVMSPNGNYMVREVSFMLDEYEWEKLYNYMKHTNGDCWPDDCEYCQKELEKE